MRALILVCTAAVLIWPMAVTANAEIPSFDSEYFGESAFLTVVPGQSNEFTVFFGNTGTATWAKNTRLQVNLAICREDKVTCNVFSPNATWNDGWLSNIAYTTHTQDTVAPGEIGTFKYRIKPPLNLPHSIYRFHGDLVLAATLNPVHPQGYYQDATIG